MSIHFLSFHIRPVHFLSISFSCHLSLKVFKSSLKSIGQGGPHKSPKKVIKKDQKRVVNKVFGGTNFWWLVLLILKPHECTKANKRKCQCRHQLKTCLHVKPLQDRFKVKGKHLTKHNFQLYLLPPHLLFGGVLITFQFKKKCC